MKTLPPLENKRVRPRWPVLPLLAFFATVILLLILFLFNNHSLLRGSWLTTSSSLSIVALSLSLLLLAVIPLFIGRRFDGFDWFSFIYLASASYILHFVLRAFYVLANPSAIMGSLRYWDTFVKALLYTNIGFAFLLLGYYLPFARKLASTLPPLPFKWPDNPSLLKILLLYTLGSLGRWLAFLQIVPSSLSYFPIALGKLTTYALILIAIYSFVHSPHQRWFRLALLLALPFQILYALVWSNGKFELILAILIILMCQHYLNHPIRPRQILLAILLIFIIIFPVIGIYRNLPSSDFLTRSTQTIDSLASTTIPAYLNLTLNFVMIRSHLLDSFAVIIYSFPAHYLGITDYLLIPAYAFIPRFIWPDKPIELGSKFAQTYFDVTGPTSFAISTPADLYQHGGLMVVIAGLFIFGLLYRFAHHYLIKRPASLPLAQKIPPIFSYIIIFVNFYLIFETQLITGIVELLKQLLFVILISFYMNLNFFKSKLTNEEIG
ncbi:MAG: hypothetical protein IT308_10270 [Anaerolineaceae bacterium]|nr:hypothetical protein [Anaerolineaceae bacterium]